MAERPALIEQFESASDDVARLRILAELLKSGAFDYVPSLRPMLAGDDSDGRLYAGRLLAHTCNHDQVSWFGELLDAAESLEEHRKAILFIGETLSLRAIPLLLQFRRDMDENVVDDYIRTSLNVVFPLRSAKEDFDADAIEAEFIEATRGTDAGTYYFHGAPVFAGDLTRRMIEHAGAIRGTSKTFALSYEPDIVANFNGVDSPVAYGDRITDERFERLLTYTKDLAAHKWTRGAKYFYRHQVPAQ
jgi:hypothetical protein